jgi:2-oxoglutarate ferredoxin oxidoreductase subunit gamma
MKHELLAAGFGGQGVLSMGMTLAYAGVIEGKEITWMPSYGPEMRGGTANCTVIIADKTISSPCATTFDSVIALNQPSLDKFEKSVRPGGLLIFDSTTIVRQPTRTDIRILPLPASDEAVKLSDRRIMNMIVLGALLKITGIVRLDAVITALKKVLPDRYHHLIPLNERALQRGMDLAG